MKTNKELVNQHSVNDIDENITHKCSSESTTKTLENLLQPFGGNEKFYRRLISVFEANLEQQLQKLALMTAQKNAKEILGIVHTLKGSAGSTGLSSLYRDLCECETKLKQAYDSNTSAFDMLCVDLAEQLRFVAQTDLSNIHALLLNQSQIKPSETAPQQAEYTITELKLILAELKQHLDDFNLKAVDIAELLQSNRAQKLSLEHNFTALCDAVEVLDFEKALIELSSLSEGL
ncbi:Hpt domain-containing protein [Shewanella glacialimarina]|jgi:HPt (histidine-containing phosphotransfer) domain-containing protein|uniref:Hpt domain-containing protein n=1 Tax=Shewanella glacialimarina TaxID=2590884 RepID=UPI001CF85388|nr:Hpt domain-containing protein [Shewanella glacialimarina]UCX05120.1 hypothetical protein FJ709_11785 [Shewanella glacialimarina]